MKLRSLFKDQSTSSTVPLDHSQSTGTSSPPTGTSSPPPGMLPPSNLPLSSGVQDVLGSTTTPAGHTQTPPANTRAQTFPTDFDPSATPSSEVLPPFPGPHQSQQLQENLDAQLKRALSPETIQGGDSVLISAAGLPQEVLKTSDGAPGSTLEPSSVVSSSSLTPSSTSSSSTSSSSAPSSPENTLHRSSPLPKGTTVADGASSLSDQAVGQTTNIGRFHVSKSSIPTSEPSSGAKVGRFFVTVTPAPSSSPSRGSSMQNGPSTSNPQNTHAHYSSDNDDDSGTEDEALQKEISRLREKHMMEIQSLQARQKEEIEALYTQMGKDPPPSVFSPAVAMTGGRRRTKSKTYKGRSSGQPSPIHSAQILGSESSPKQGLPSATEAGVGRMSTERLTTSPSLPILSSASTGSSGTSSTNGSGLCQNVSTSASQVTGLPPSGSQTQKGKGTFTDDLHQLVDNWARDVISLSQCKKGPKTGAQATLEPEIIPSANMGRKFSAPGYLCPAPTPSNNTSTTTTTHLSSATNPTASLGPRKGSLQPVAQSFGYASGPYSAPQWAGPTGTCQVSVHNPAQPLKQYQPPTTAASIHQGYHMGATPTNQMSANHGGANPRPT